MENYRGNIKHLRWLYRHWLPTRRHHVRRHRALMRRVPLAYLARQRHRAQRDRHSKQQCRRRFLRHPNVVKARRLCRGVLHTWRDQLGPVSLSSSAKHKSCVLYGSRRLVR